MRSIHQWNLSSHLVGGVLLWLAAVGCGGDKHRFRIKVSETSLGRPIFRIVGTWSGPRPSAMEIYVEDVKTDQRLCSLNADDETRRGVSSWRYGEITTGFAVSECQPLNPGKYRAVARGPGGAGFVEFVVDPVTPR